MIRFWKTKESASASSQPPMPVIVGSPRSGTTLLRLMLDAHSDLAIPPETGFLILSNELRGTDDKLRENFFQALVNYITWIDFGIPQDELWTSLKEIKRFSISEGYRAFYRLYAARQHKSRWGDKTPIYCRYLDTIRRVLPEARFIHIIRDGRDAALSLRKMWFSPGWEIETQAEYWRDCIHAARRAGVGRDDYFEVRYEDIVTNTRVTLEKTCAHIGLSYDDAMLSYHKHAARRLTEHKGRLLPNGNYLTQQQRFQQQRRTTEPPDPTRVFVWKQIMDVNERKRFQTVAGDLLQELGYEV